MSPAWRKELRPAFGRLRFFNGELRKRALIFRKPAEADGCAVR